MPINKNSQKYILYLLGFAKGMEKGKKRGMKMPRKAIKRMLEDGLPIKTIARYMGVTQKFVKEIQKKI